jgi:alpha-glucosidase
MRSVLPSSFERYGDSLSPLSFRNKSGNLIEIFVYNDRLFRVRHFPPGQEHVGTDLDCDRLHPTDQFTLRSEELKYFITTATVQLEIRLTDFQLVWSTMENVFLTDLPFRAYEYDKDGGVSHYVQKVADDYHYGLGERSSPLDLNGRRYIATLK